MTDTKLPTREHVVGALVTFALAATVGKEGDLREARDIVLGQFDALYAALATASADRLALVRELAEARDKFDAAQAALLTAREDGERWCFVRQYMYVAGHNDGRHRVEMQRGFFPTSRAWEGKTVEEIIDVARRAGPTTSERAPSVEAE